MSEVTPTLLHGRYEVIAVVGRGARGRWCGRWIDAMGATSRSKLRLVPDDPREAERLLIESRTLLSLHPHPGLPLARDDFFEADRHVLVMDWVEGVDLAAVLVEHGQPGLPPSTVLRWLAPVAEALTHLHRTDPPVVHGDVKPANLVLTPIGTGGARRLRCVIDASGCARGAAPPAIGPQRWPLEPCPPGRPTSTGWRRQPSLC